MNTKNNDNTEINRRKLIDRFYYITNVAVPFDGILSCLSGKLEIDITKLDENFAKYDKEYNAIGGMYKGEPCSMGEYVQKKWGNEAFNILRHILGFDKEAVDIIFEEAKDKFGETLKKLSD